MSFFFPTLYLLVKVLIEMVGLVSCWLLCFKLDDERVRCGLDIRYSEAQMLCGELTDESYVQEF